MAAYHAPCQETESPSEVPGTPSPMMPEVLEPDMAEHLQSHPVPRIFQEHGC